MPDQQLQRGFTHRLMPLARAYRRYIDKGLSSLELSHTTALAVMLIGRMGDGLRQGTLAEELGLEGASLVPLIQQLLQAGLLDRRPDPEDGRAKTLHLTDAGRSLAAEVEERSATLRARVFAGIPDEDVAAALRVMDRLAVVLQECADGTPAA
ncbi:MULTISPECIES: MarR family winged helix-turn-helix transcriptional regulator [Sphingomonas]|uniref:MarR family winged helix-turn-helix transcriptional regulator n=1 Tax=Sphingomonas TaxID=13687 RepID=UPI000F7DDA47|nr:MarR family transcriptional regulator [Sphingomonas sp. ABOLF]RSV17037.1 MarR family transcriptional regulator [Sphingomonas sp. ABOLF]GLK21745.1 MarR family transcriptional regulator [Microbacterium terregens]